MKAIPQNGNSEQANYSGNVTAGAGKVCGLATPSTSMASTLPPASRMALAAAVRVAPVVQTSSTSPRPAGGPWTDPGERPGHVLPALRFRQPHLLAGRPDPPEAIHQRQGEAPSQDAGQPLSLVEASLLESDGM